MAVRNSGALAKALKAEKGAIKPGIEAGGNKAADELKLIINPQSPPVSAPGTPPHRRSGGLELDIKAKAITATTIRLGIPDKLAVWLEYGTHTRSGTQKMAARPFFTKFAKARFPELVRASLIEHMGNAARGR